MLGLAIAPIVWFGLGSCDDLGCVFHVIPGYRGIRGSGESGPRLIQVCMRAVYHGPAYFNQLVI